MMRQIWIGALLVAVCLWQTTEVTAAYRDIVLGDGPVAYWELDEAGLDNDPVDATGNVTTLGGGWDDQGGIEFGNPGIPGSGDGTSIIFQNTSFSFACNAACGAGNVMLDQDFDDNTVLNLGTIDDDTPITMEAWFTLLEGWENTSFPRIFHYNNLEGGQYTFGLVGTDSAGFPQYTVWGGRGDGAGGSVIIGGEQDDLPIAEDVDEEEWFHLVAQSQGDEIRLYLNGTELEDLSPSDPIGWQATQATIGARIQNNFSVVQPFPGQLDEIAIYDRYLTEEEIVSHYNAGLGLTEPCDLNSDGVCDYDDLETLDTPAEKLLYLTTPAPDGLGTVLGDVNLDMKFNPDDLIGIFAAGKYNIIAPARYDEGDYNFDGKFDPDDLIEAFAAGTYDTGGATAAVPEPGSVMLLGLASLGLLGYRRRS